MTENTQIQRGLLNLDLFCEYLGIKKTKARELLHNPANGFTVRVTDQNIWQKGHVNVRPSVKRWEMAGSPVKSRDMTNFIEKK